MRSVPIVLLAGLLAAFPGPVATAEEEPRVRTLFDAIGNLFGGEPIESEERAERAPPASREPASGAERAEGSDETGAPVSKSPKPGKAVVPEGEERSIGSAEALPASSSPVFGARDEAEPDGPSDGAPDGATERDDVARPARAPSLTEDLAASRSVELPPETILGELEKPDVFFLVPRARTRSDEQLIRARIRREITRPVIKDWLEEELLLE